MRRLAATLRCDVRLQLRNGFYWAVAFILAAFVVVITQFASIDWARILPPLLLGNLVVATFYFMGGLVLLEKSEGTLEPLLVTPLTAGEYLLSKVVTLSALSLGESFVIVLLSHGPRFEWLALFAGVALAAALYCLAGFLVVMRYDSINEYLLPTILYTTVLMLPILDGSGLWETPVMYLHPFQAPLVLMRAAFHHASVAVLVYGVAYSLLWIGILSLGSERVFRRFVLARMGVSA